MKVLQNDWCRLLLCLTVLTCCAMAQVDPNVEQGLKPFGSYHGGDIDSVSMTNGNVTLHVPLVGFPQRGSLNLNFFLRYNGKGWHVISYFDSFDQVWIYQWQWSGTGVEVIRDGAMGLQDDSHLVPINTGPPGRKRWLSLFSALTPDGGSHQLGDTGGGSYESVDTTGIRLDFDTGVVTDRSGIRNTLVSDCVGAGAGEICPVTTTEDPNGNKITVDSSGWTDTLGRLIPGSQQGLEAISGTYYEWSDILPGIASGDLSTCPAGTVSARNWDVPSPTGTSRYKLCYSTLVIHTDFNVVPYTESEYTTVRFLTAVVLPDLTSWLFAYNTWGDLASVTLPTGGTISYTWTSVGACARTTPASRFLATRTVDANDGTGPHTWTYSWNGPNKVTDPLGNDIVYTIAPNMGCSYYEGQRDYYQGSSTGGTLLKSVKTEYNSLGNPFDKYTANDSVINAVPFRRTTSWPSDQGLQNQTVTGYDSGATFSLYNNDTNTSFSHPLVYGSLISQSETHYGVGTPGAVSRQTASNYKWQTDSSYLTANLLELPSSTITTDGSGNKCAETDYEYDDPVRLVPSGITTQHGDPSGPVRGNVSSVSRWLSSTPCQPGASGTLITSYTNVYDTGMIKDTIDPLGHTTTYSYDSSFFGAFPTQTQYPTTNGIQHITHADYDLNSGLKTSFTDENGKVTSYSYDNMSRQTLTSRPDGGQTTWAYTSAAPFKVTTTTKVTDTLNLVQEAEIDGLGRVTQTRLLSDPEGTTKVDTTYDAKGRKWTVSNPYRSTSESTYGITTFTYDALNRVTQVNQPDNSIVTNTYTQNLSLPQPSTVTTVTDEAGNQRRSSFDALGRIIQVDEPSPQIPTAAGSGSATVSGTEQSQQTTQPGASGTGNVSISGAVQSTQVLTQSATNATGSVTISGTEQYPPTICYDPPCTVYDSGTISIIVGGVWKTVSYGQGSTSSSRATALRNAINADQNYPATASGSGSTVNLTSRATGTAANLSLSTDVTFNSDYYMHQSFYATPSGGTLTGGQNAVYSTVYDSGSTTITVNGHADSASWGQGSTASSIASALASNINNDGAASVTATASGATVYLTARTTGVATNYTLSTQVSFDTSHFATASFSGTRSGANLTGGMDQTTSTVYDAGTAAITVNGHATSVSWGQNSTATSVASALASAINSDPAAFVTASATNGAITLTGKTTGASTNYSLSASSSSSQGFSPPSFTVSVSGANLTGGADASGGLGTPYMTLYKYDGLGNLICVEQHGDANGTGCDADPSNDANSAWRVRRFTYNSLSQLLTAKNPESGTISYQYDNDGNLLTKTDARGITINYSPAESPIDALHRVTKKTYSNGDPAVSYFYDQASYDGLTITEGIGRRTGMSDGAGQSAWSYDLMGRVATARRTTNGSTKDFGYSYNLSGSSKTITYPTAGGQTRTVTYGYDSAGRPNVSSDSGRTYVQVDATEGYTPHGALGKAVLGGVVTLENTYQPRLQPSVMSATAGANTLMSRSYDFHLGAGDNGNVYGITDDLDALNLANRPVGSANYSYDALNRLTQFVTTGNNCTSLPGGATKNSGNSYGIDAWGNLTSKGAPSPPLNGCVAESLSEGVGYDNRFTGTNRYDAAGNLTQNGAYTYDAENRLKTAAGATYWYDGDGNRVQKSGTANMTYWSGAGTDTLAEGDGDGNVSAHYIFFGGKRTARIDNPGGTESVHYYISDHLGSATVIASASGASEGETMYSPFGGERWSNTTDSNRYKFTGKERDAETGLDYFGARYYGSTIGRWTSPDWTASPEPVPYAKLDIPQSLNLYAYVLNSPVTNRDLDGHVCIFGFGNTCAGNTPPPPIKRPPPAVPRKAFLASLGNMKINKLTVNQVAQIVTNEQANVKPGQAGAAELDKAKAAEANAVMNADQKFGNDREKRAGTEPFDVNKASNTQADHDREVVQQALYERAINGTDTAAGRTYIGNAATPIASRPIGDGRQTSYSYFGPFNAPTGKNFVIIYNDPE